MACLSKWPWVLQCSIFLEGSYRISLKLIIKFLEIGGFSPSAHRRDGDGVLGPSKHFRWMENQKQLWDSLDFHRDHFSGVSVYPPSHRNLCGFPCESCPLTGGIILSLLHPAPLWVGSSPAKNGGTPAVPASPASTPPTTVTWSSYQWWFSWDLMGISWWFFGIYMDLWWFMMIWWFDLIKKKHDLTILRNSKPGFLPSSGHTHPSDLTLGSTNRPRTYGGSSSLLDFWAARGAMCITARDMM